MSSASSALLSTSSDSKSGKDTAKVMGENKMSGSGSSMSSSPPTPNLSADELAEYLKMLELLGFFPDKILINTLTMIAEDYAGDVVSSRKIYNAIRHMLISPKVVAGRKLPLVYVMDSLLKNARGQYIKLMEDESNLSSTTAKTESTSASTSTGSNDKPQPAEQCWVNVVYDQLTQSNRDEERQKLRRVLNTWKQFQIFVNDPTVVDRLLSRFLEADKVLKEKNLQGNQMLQVSAKVKRKMESMLDEMYADEGINELEKVSLERLANVNPDLLKNIRQAAEQELKNEEENGIRKNEYYDDSALSSSQKSSSATIFGETRSDEEIALSDEWASLKFDISGKNGSQNMVDELQHFLMDQTSNHKVDQKLSNIPKDEYVDENGWVNLLVCTSVCATHLTNMMQRIYDKEHTDESSSYSSVHHTSNQWDAKRVVKKDDFTTDGVKKRVDNVITRLYEAMPFVSSNDGRRFLRQEELAKYLDKKIRMDKKQKLMIGKEQRAWFPTMDEWCCIEKSAPAATSDQTESSTSITGTTNQVGETATTNLPTHPLDESRPRCRICGINFEVIFDEYEGVYMNSDCREMVVSPTNEEVLVHAHCVTNLGSPTVLTTDQLLTFT